MSKPRMKKILLSVPAGLYEEIQEVQRVTYTKAQNTIFLQAAAEYVSNVKARMPERFKQDDIDALYK